MMTFSFAVSKRLRSAERHTFDPMIYEGCLAPLRFGFKNQKLKNLGRTLLIALPLIQNGLHHRKHRGPNRPLSMAEVLSLHRAASIQDSRALTGWQDPAARHPQCDGRSW